MIITFLLIIFTSVVSWLLNLLPTGIDFASEIEDSFDLFLTYVSGWNWILPVSEAITIIKYSLIIMFAIIIWKTINWTIALIRGSNPTGSA